MFTKYATGTHPTPLIAVWKPSSQRPDEAVVPAKVFIRPSSYSLLLVHTWHAQNKIFRAMSRIALRSSQPDAMRALYLSANPFRPDPTAARAARKSTDLTAR